MSLFKDVWAKRGHQEQTDRHLAKLENLTNLVVEISRRHVSAQSSYAFLHNRMLTLATTAVTVLDAEAASQSYWTPLTSIPSS